MNISLQQTQWHQHEPEIRRVRHLVYIEEQGIDPADEWIAAEEIGADYIIATVRNAETGEDSTIGCIRLMPNGKFGRLAVLRDYRQYGIGAKLVKAVIQLAQSKNMAVLKATAQCYALPFYWRLGFHACGELFDDAGIPHVMIELPLSGNIDESHKHHLMLGKDSKSWPLHEGIQAEGFLISILSQPMSSLTIALDTPEQLRWHQPRLMDALQVAAKRFKSRKICLLLKHDKDIHDLPLLKLAARLDSRFEVRINPQLKQSYWLFGQYGWFASPAIKPGLNTPYDGCPYDVDTVGKLQRQLHLLFEEGQRSQALKRVYL